MPCGLRFWKRKAKKKARDVDSVPPVDPTNAPIANRSTLAPMEPTEELLPRPQAKTIDDKKDEIGDRRDNTLNPTLSGSNVVDGGVPPVDPPIANSSTLAPTEPADALSPRQQAELMGGGEGNSRERRDEADGKLDSALTATGVVLGLVVEAADFAPFGVLKTAASLSLKIVEICQAVKENDNQYRILADDASQFIAVIWRSYQQSPTQEAWLTPDLKQVVEELVRTLTDINGSVEEKRDRRTFTKMLSSPGDTSQIQAYRVRIDMAVKRFEIFSHLKVTEMLQQVLNQQNEIKKRLLSNDIAVNAPGAHVLSPQDEARLKVVYDTAAPNAILNAGGRADEVRCYPGTREEVLAKSEAWMEPAADQQLDDSRKGIFWLSGPAGAGKSAIMQTLAERRLASGLPMANFFFFRNDATRSNVHPLVATILVQFLKKYPVLKPLIAAVLADNPLIIRQSLSDQFQHLIDIPIRTLRAAYPSLIQQPIVLLIDGLDECSLDAKHEQRSLLKVLHDLASRDGSPFLVFVASRPEPHLTMTFNEVGASADSIFLDKDYRPEDDIRLYVIAELAKIRRNHHLGPTLAPDWPTNNQIGKIVDKSSGQFIYAATVIRFISGSSASPAFSLDIVHSLRPMSRTSPFAELDALYTHILSQVGDWKSAKDVLAVHLLKERSRFLFSLSAGLFPLGYEGSNVPSFVSDLPALVKLEASGDLELYHASLSDFLRDKSRSGDYYIDISEFCDTRAPDFVRCIRDRGSLFACCVIIGQVSGLSWSITEALLSHPTLGFQFAPFAWVDPVYFMGEALRNYCRNDDKLYKELVQLWIVWFRKCGVIFVEHDNENVWNNRLQRIKAQLDLEVWEEIIRSSKAEEESSGSSCSSSTPSPRSSIGP